MIWKEREKKYNGWSNGNDDMKENKYDGESRQYHNHYKSKNLKKITKNAV